MLNSSKKDLFINFMALLILLAMVACTPTPTTSQLTNANSTDTPTTPASLYSEPVFPLPGLFVQDGATRSETNFSLNVNYSDSFLIRGKSLSVFLRTIPNTTKFCIVGEFNYTSNATRFLIMSGKPKSFTDLAKKTTEFYLQVEPNNDVANQNDCISYNLTNEIFLNKPSPSAHFSLTQLCSNCTSSVTSGGLKLFFLSGEEVPNLKTNSLLLTISGSTSTSGNSCSESTSCRARGFDCCLQSVCVTDGALRPGAMNLPGFLSAKEDVKLNPDRYVVYPQFYFVCESKPNDPVNPNPPDSSDPDYEASVRLIELKHLYDCINKVDGEFSHCTLKYTQADQLMPRIFTAGDSTSGGFNDDINFSSINSTFRTGDYVNNIFKIVYGGQTYYEQNKILKSGVTFITDPESTHKPNDNLTSTQGVSLNLELPVNARDANLYITYKVDGTCTRLSSNLAKCVKSYVYDSSDTTLTTWHDDTNTFLLPEYADLSTNGSVIVKVSNINIPEDSTKWRKLRSPNRIEFVPGYKIYQNQVVEITYFVKDNPSELTKMRTEAQKQVNSMCSCVTSAQCNLKPVLDKSNAVINYECSYPSDVVSNEPPANQTVYVSNKNIAHRYFDSGGVAYDESIDNATPQELASFSYTNNNIVKPNNLTSYVGFNEIYGSFAKSGTYIARPAKMVRVKKDKLYDILVDSGTFSSCPTCGSDYYSSLQKIFPQNFGGQGGGYAPDNYASRRELNSSLYRADDLLFGRACFVPATMIPWTHVSKGEPRDQRRARLKAQHFLFANGYNRDWYGFDYGSIIGSFDGVTWFSIGNQRRIKATSNRMYLAVNAYLGDLNIDNNFNITVSETSLFSSEIPDHDTETDGAQCQRSHFCSTDNDCFRQLGYDYSCQNVSQLTTRWPQFDANASEVSGSVTRTLSSIIGGINGQAKRCVYRGRGTPCLNDLSTAESGSAFNSSKQIGALACSSNHSCVKLDTPNRFNNRIARFANTPVIQNNSLVASSLSSTIGLSDTVGLGARIILRPFNFFGQESVSTDVSETLLSNNVNAICIPGKDLANAQTTHSLNSRHPTVRTETADKIFGVGPTMSSTSLKSLNACPAVDNNGNNLLHSNPARLMTDADISKFAISQNMSSNLLDLAPLNSLKIFSSSGATQVTSVGYQRNTCLRPAGAACFSDMECAPSTFIASKAKASNLTSVLNSAEAKFWEEELVCGNPDPRTLSNNVPNPNFDIKKNKCCREIGKIINVFTQTEGSDFKWCSNLTTQVAGVNQSISAQSRYSKVHSVYDKMTCNIATKGANTKFALSVEGPSAENRMAQILGQYKTLDTLNQRTCCTNHWVRSFASSNGGGHAFSKTKMQNIDKFMFRNISWGPDNTTLFDPDPDDPFECGLTNFADASCEIKNLTPAEEEKYLTWAATLELIGIPQVAIKTDDQIYKLVNDTQSASLGPGFPLTEEDGARILLPSSNDNADFIDGSGHRYYSATNYTQMNMNVAGQTSNLTNSLKKVFSENEFNCCIPSGEVVTETTTASQCCTGFAANLNGPRRCCLPDFTDVTVYLNRYVSSEGRGLPDSAYDEATGYIKDPGQVKLMVAQKNLCCSGTTMTGVAISQLPIPLEGSVFRPAETLATTRRFAYRSDIVDNNTETGSVGAFFEAGVRWNNHVYCVPANLVQNSQNNNQNNTSP